MEYSKYLYFFILAVVAIFLYLYQKKKGTGFKMGSSSTTPFLDMYTFDFTRQAQEGKIDPVIGREDEVLKLAQVLSRRSKNNAILLGEPGVGKTAIVEGLAKRIIENDVPSVLSNKRLLSLEVSSLMSGTKYRGEFEERAKKIVTELAAAGRTIILFVDEVHAVVQSHGTEGAVNFADILKPALARGELQMIGATTFAEYKKYIKPEPSLERRFQPIEVKEPTVEETILILQGIKDKYREYHKVEFTDAALEVAASLSSKKISGRKLPDKAIDAIDEAAAMVRVAHIHEAVPAVLYQAVKNKDNSIHESWQKLQNLDTKIQKAKNKEKSKLVKERDELELALSKKGLIIVDSDDIEKVIKDWSI